MTPPHADDVGWWRADETRLGRRWAALAWPAGSGDRLLAAALAATAARLSLDNPIS